MSNYYNKLKVTSLFVDKDETASADNLAPEKGDVTKNVSTCYGAEHAAKTLVKEMNNGAVGATFKEAK